MTIALQYLSDLSRVRISLSDLPDGTVQVQRALNPAATDAIWEQGVVRGGRALPVSGGVAQLDDYEFHADVENHYRVVSVDPGPGLVLEVASIKPSLNGRVWLKSIRYPGLNRPVTPAEYGDVGHSDRSGAFAISGASLPLAVTDHAGGRDHPLMLVTRDQPAEDKLRVLLRLGGVIFVHVPATPPADLDGNRLLPGSMYAVARGWSVRRAGGVSDVQLFNLPLQEVRKPSADVVGTTLTVGQLIAEHDSIESVWAAYPSIRDMWDDIGDINDLVVI